MNLLLRIEKNIDIITSSSIHYPPSFPPPDEWPVTLDQKGNVLSRYKDDFWDFSAFGFSGFNFKKHKITPKNLMFFKETMFFILYHPNIFPGKVITCAYYFTLLSKVAVFCDDNNIDVNNLCRHQNLYPSFITFIKKSNYYRAVALFHKLKIHKGQLGFSIADDNLLKLMVKTLKSHNHETIQHAYIPPRIWNYQVSRLDEAINDFIKHQNDISSAYAWICNAYEFNRKNVPIQFQSPFLNKSRYKSQRIFYPLSFDDFLREWNLFELLKRWIKPNNPNYPGGYGLNKLTRYLNFIRDVSMIFILNFSIQRKSEGLSLRSDCFCVEKDNHLGDVCFIVGETTKTETDSDARWIVPKIVKKAIDASSWIAKLRISFLADSDIISIDDIKNPYLMFPSLDIWNMNSYNVIKILKKGKTPSKINQFDYECLQVNDLKLFDIRELQLTDEDAKVALSLTPNLHDIKWFQVGKPWHFSTHQLRRTLAVNMFASGSISVSSIQYQMKHHRRDMTLYYGRHYTNLRLNSTAEAIILFEYYSRVYQNILDVVEDEMEFVRPHGKNPISATIVNLIDAGEEKKLMKLVCDGKTGIRRTLLGFCAKVGSCEYGGIESISKCAGGNGGGICADAIFVRKNEEKLRKLRDAHQLELEQLSADSMRTHAIKQEIYAIEVYLNVIQKNR